MPSKRFWSARYPPRAPELVREGQRLDGPSARRRAWAWGCWSSSWAERRGAFSSMHRIARASGELVLVISPQADEVATEALAERFDVRLVAAPKLEHQVLVWRSRPAPEHTIAQLSKAFATHP